MSDVVDEQLEAGCVEVFVATKLTRPPVRPDHLRRERLLATLRDRSARRHVLVAAPPGFGKTTLLSTWAAGEEGVAWLWLDAGDNDPVRFVSYLIEALQTVHAEVGSQARVALRGPGAGLAEVVLPLLVNDLAGLADAVALVLDDYHAITNPAVHEALGYLLERAPPSLRIVIASREDPPLPLPRLRARDDLAEIRAADLRFSEDEARAFLAEALPTPLSDKDAERLRERTEGWPAALHLATLSLRASGDPAAFLDAFSGDDRHVGDYLTSEVLASLDLEVRAFLTETSILDRFTAPLCDAVRGRDDSAAILRALEQSNQLLMPLDTRRRWYRYHPLLADVLRQEACTRPPVDLATAHARASAWYSDEGLIVDAARHAHAGGNTIAAVDLLARYWPRFFEQGQLATVAGWIEALPAGALDDDWSLCLAAASVMTHLHRLDEARSWLEAARAAPPQTRNGELRDGPLASQEASLSLFAGDVTGTMAAARRAVAAVADRERGWSVVARVALGAALWWSGDAAEARAVFENARPCAQEAGSALGEVCALGFGAALDLEAGDVEAAVAGAEAAAKLAADRELTGFPFTAVAPIVLGRTLARRGDHAGAIALIAPALDLAQREDTWVIRTYGLLALAEVEQRRGDARAARRAITQARDLVSALPDPGAALAFVERTERLLKLTPRTRRDQGAGDFWELSERELEVLRLLASSLSQREIAGELFVSFSTVKSHVRSIFRKLAVDSRTDAVNRARELGLL